MVWVWTLFLPLCDSMSDKGRSFTRLFLPPPYTATICNIHVSVCARILVFLHLHSRSLAGVCHGVNLFRFAALFTRVRRALLEMRVLTFETAISLPHLSCLLFFWGVYTLPSVQQKEKMLILSHSPNGEVQDLFKKHLEAILKYTFLSLNTCK